MLYILANDAQLAKEWAEERDIPADEWCVATAEKLEVLPSGMPGDERLVILEGAETNPQYKLILDLAHDRGIAAATATATPQQPPD